MILFRAFKSPIRLVLSSSKNPHRATSPLVSILRNFSVQNDCHFRSISFGNHYLSRNLYHEQISKRNFTSSSDTEVNSPTEGEIKLKNVIKKHFPKASDITVEDISGGCGSMYQIYIVASEFKGLTTVKQHRLVNEALKQEIKSMHGIRIQTAVPKDT